MNLLFLDDQREMLETYRLIENPALFGPRKCEDFANLFADPPVD